MNEAPISKIKKKLAEAGIPLEDVLSSELQDLRNDLSRRQSALWARDRQLFEDYFEKEISSQEIGKLWVDKYSFWERVAKTCGWQIARGGAVAPKVKTTSEVSIAAARSVAENIHDDFLQKQKNSKEDLFYREGVIQLIHHILVENLESEENRDFARLEIRIRDLENASQNLIEYVAYKTVRPLLTATKRDLQAIQDLVTRPGQAKDLKLIGTIRPLKIALKAAFAHFYSDGLTELSEKDVNGLLKPRGDIPCGFEESGIQNLFSELQKEGIIVVNRNQKNFLTILPAILKS